MSGLQKLVEHGAVGGFEGVRPFDLDQLRRLREPLVIRLLLESQARDHLVKDVSLANLLNNELLSRPFPSELPREENIRFLDPRYGQHRFLAASARFLVKHADKTPARSLSRRSQP